MWSIIAFILGVVIGFYRFVRVDIIAEHVPEFINIKRQYLVYAVVKNQDQNVLIYLPVRPTLYDIQHAVVVKIGTDLQTSSVVVKNISPLF